MAAGGAGAPRSRIQREIQIVTGACLALYSPRGLPNGPPWVPAALMGGDHSLGAAELIAMSKYVAVNTLFTLPTPQPGALGRQFSEFPAASRSADRICGIGLIGPYHLAIVQPLF